MPAVLVMSAPCETEADVRARVCGDKIGHPTHDKARPHAERLNAEQPGAGFAPYRCPFCKRWHVGHLPSIFALEATARVMRGLDPRPPQPHDPPERRKRRRTSKGSHK